jgi:hypothetical protein
MMEGAPCVAARRLTLREAIGTMALVIAQAGNARPRFLNCRIAALSNYRIAFMASIILGTTSKASPTIP